jgi:hypothetical protein
MWHNVVRLSSKETPYCGTVLSANLADVSMDESLITFLSQWYAVGCIMSLKVIMTKMNLQRLIDMQAIFFRQPPCNPELLFCFKTRLNTTEPTRTMSKSDGMPSTSCK